MKRFVINIILLFALITGVFCTPVICHAREKEELVPVYGKDIKDGSYSVEVDSSSSMFRIVHAELTVADGNMTAVITLSGTGYLELFMGTGEEALEAEETAYIPYVEDAEGAYTYTIPVEVLNQEFDCAAFSKRKEKWYDRQLVFLAASLPEDAVLIELTENPDLRPVEMQVEDGSYTMEVSLTGGSGRASVVSPAQINVAEKIATASIEWSSPDYDYMIVNGKKYFPVNTEGNSVFEIPVLALDQEIDVIANTLAMSKPHEIEYRILFHSDTMQSSQNIDIVIILLIVVVVMVIICGWFTYSKKWKHNEKKKKVQNA